MTSAWDEKSVFLAALDLPAHQRGDYLRSACPDDAARERIEALLLHHDAVTREILDARPIAERECRADDLTRIAEFQIVRRLGEGGMGIVYLAEDLILGRRVALKILSPGLTGSEDALARFRTEARSTAAIKHPAIVPVYKFGSDGTTHYIASEFVDGPTLAQVIEAERGRRTGPIGAAQLRTWVRAAADTVSVIAEALQAAHRQQIIHRDVKPSNILLDGEQLPHLTDFGIARHLTEETRDIGTTLEGTCHYMSPEQASIANSRVDQRSDVFSLGVVLYELVSLRRPFDGPDQAHVLKAVAERAPLRLTALDKRIPSDLETICLKAVEKRPSDRYQSAAHVAADLRCFLEDRPILAARPRFTRRARFWIRSHRRLAMALLTLSLAALCLSTLAFAVARESRHWKAQRCAVDVNMLGDDVVVHIRRIDPETFGLGERLACVPTKDRQIWLLPGQYRIDLRNAGGRFDEMDCLFLEPREQYLVTPMFHAGPTTLSPMVRVPGGTLLYSGPFTDEGEPGRRVTVETFWIDRDEVTNRNYLDFLASTGHKRPDGWGEAWPPREYDGHPVVGINWDDMHAYARWAGKRLPTVLEWEHAARWPDGRVLPWGKVVPATHPTATGKHRELMNEATWKAGMQVYAVLAHAVDSDPDPSALGLHFMLGNAAEMTGSVTSSKRTLAVVVKGGSWMERSESHDLTANELYPIGPASMTLGFRCASSMAPEGQHLQRRND